VGAQESAARPQRNLAVTGLIAETSGWERFAKSEAELRNAVGRYARLMHKADKGRLQGNELDQLLLTALNIRNEARELGLTNRQLELMLEKMVEHLDRSTPTQRAS
jgi:hypothetical protein